MFLLFKEREMDGGMDRGMAGGINYFLLEAAMMLVLSTEKAIDGTHYGRNSEVHRQSVAQGRSPTLL